MIRFRKLSRRSLTLAVLMAVGLCTVGVSSALLIGGAGGPTTSGSSANNLQSGLIGYWPLNGNAKDSTPYADNGTVTSANLTADRKGSTNSAYSFNGTSGNISVPSTSLFDTSTLSVGAWLYPTASTASATAIGRFTSGSGPDGWTVGNGSTVGNFQFFLRVAGSNYTVASTTNYTLNAWHYVIGTYDGTTARLFVDGAQVATTAATGSIISSTQNLRFGARTTSNNYWPGNLDDIRLYNRAITANEVAALYKQYDPALRTDAGQSGLGGWWKLDGNYKDSSPYGGDVTVAGSSPTVTTDRKGTTNSAYSFSAASSQGLVNSNFSGRLTGLSNISLSGWVKPPNLPGSYQGYFGMRNNTNADFYILQLSGTNRLECRFRPSSGTTYTISTVTITPNVWQLVTLTYDGSTLGCSVNTNAPTTVAASGTITSTSSSFYIGSSNNTYYLTGSIDDVRVYKRTLSSTDIANLYGSYNSQVQVSNLQSGLVADWPFNGNAKDSTPYANTGTVTGPTLTTDRKGRANSSYAFAGNNSYIQVADSAAIDPASTISISAWIYPTDWGGNRRILQKAGDGQGYRLLYESGYLKFDLCGIGSLVWATPPATGQYTLVTATYDGSSEKLYYNGTFITSNSVGGAICSNSTPLVIGNKPGSTYGNDSFYGSIDDVRIWNRSLSAAEVTTLYIEYR